MRGDGISRQSRRTLPRSDRRFWETTPSYSVWASRASNCPHYRPLHLTFKSTNARSTRAFGLKQSSKSKLEFRRQVAVDFETDADFNQNRRRPGHTVLPLSLRNILEPKNGTARHRGGCGDEARRIAANVVKLPELPLDPNNVIFFPCPA